ncbi:MAG: retron St85 family RNA-directed DNA polymerase [Nanoarchaeota archaeon]|nr:retron St85 family RNA-directed DNA polymerase [Nanoarchaeota archaeon]
MSARFNWRIILWALGVVQPATAKEIRELLLKVFPDAGRIPSQDEFKVYLNLWEKERLVGVVNRKSAHYSLTSRGNYRMGSDLRYNRDKVRLFLMKEARRNRIYLSGEQIKELVGDSPTVIGSREIYKRHRPIIAALPCFGRNYWPMLLGQLLADPLKNGSPDNHLALYSFPSFESLISSYDRFSRIKKPSLHLLALAIGISPRLISYIIYKRPEHYRQFEIGKRGGGTRNICSPRVFLKTIQYWILDYLLFALKIHPSCNSYQKGKSIITNASDHVGKNYVANIDIKDFFNSISERSISKFLCNQGYDAGFSELISKLVTLNDGLPQGAPTSPHISNAFMYQFDEKIFKFCEKLKMVYSRYADDMTISGSNKKDIIRGIGFAKQYLDSMGLSLNESKTRIASKGGQQKVTGIVVNSHISPPRMFRRKIRAMFHNAYKNPKEYRDKQGQLKGYLCYLCAFPGVLTAKDKEIYVRTINRLSSFAE